MLRFSPDLPIGGDFKSVNAQQEQAKGVQKCCSAQLGVHFQPIRLAGTAFRSILSRFRVSKHLQPNYQLGHRQPT